MLTGASRVRPSVSADGGGSAPIQRNFHACPLVFSAHKVPTTAPGSVQAEAVNSTTIRFTWTAPNPQFINGINQGYKVSAGRTPSQRPMGRTGVPQRGRIGDP